jgi:hypothetical protein
MHGPGVFCSQLLGLDIHKLQVLGYDVSELQVLLIIASTTFSMSHQASHYHTSMLLVTRDEVSGKLWRKAPDRHVSVHDLSGTAACVGNVRARQP